jgi:hypothetical protein
MANSPAPLETIACFHCARQLQATKLSNRFSVCLKCKSCGGYSEASIRNGKVEVKPIKTSEVKIRAGIFAFAAAISGIAAIFFIIKGVSLFSTAPEALIGFIPSALFTGALAYFFILKTIVILRGNP